MATALERFRVLRQSRLATFDRCALSAKFEEQYEGHWSTTPQASGTMFHRFAAKALETMYAQQVQEIPAAVALGILEEVLRQSDIDKRCPDCPAPIVRRYQPTDEEGRPKFPMIVCERGHEHSSELVNLPMSEVKDLRWMVVKWARENRFDIENLIDVEQRLKTTLRYVDDDGRDVERVLTGQLDALFIMGEEDEHAVVLDWKSGWGVPPPAELGFDGYFQQRFYALLVFDNLPSISAVTLREQYPRTGAIREATLFRSDLDEIRGELAALVLRFDRAWTEMVFPPTPGHHCQYCPRPSACPIFPGVRGEGQINDRETAERVAREMTVAQAALDHRKVAMSAWTSVHGPMEVSSHKGRRGWRHKPGNRTKSPSREQLEQALALQRRGVPVDLDELYETTVVSRFGLGSLEVVGDTADDAVLTSALEQSLSALGGTVSPPTEEDS